MNDRELYHYGIKGQKWGVRRFQNKDGSLTNAGKKRQDKMADKEKKTAMKKDVKNRRTLSDADLKKKIERIKMEKQLKDLTAEEISPGKKFVSDVMSASGKKVATALASGAMLYGVKVAMTKKFDIKDAAAYMTPKPKK